LEAAIHSQSRDDLPDHHGVGLFSIFVVAYIFYKGRSLNGPYAPDLLTWAKFPWGGSIALFGSSLTIWIAEKMLHKGNKFGFQLWWGITILMGAYFMYSPVRSGMS